MKAAVMRANDAPLELEDIRIDEPGPGEVLVKTAASGICHSDLTVLEGEYRGNGPNAVLSRGLG